MDVTTVAVDQHLHCEQSGERVATPQKGDDGHTAAGSDDAAQVLVQRQVPLAVERMGDAGAERQIEEPFGHGLEEAALEQLDAGGLQRPRRRATPIMIMDGWSCIVPAARDG